MKELTFSDIYRARSVLLKERRPPVAIVAGPEAMANLLRSIPTVLWNPNLAPNALGPCSLFGLSLIEDDTKPPDYLAVKRADGALLPVAEV